MNAQYIFWGMYGIYILSRIAPLLLTRWRAERARQQVITRPKTYARLGDKRKLVKKTIKDDRGSEETYWEPNLQEPYTYFQKGQAYRHTRVAPGNMKLNQKQAWELESFLYAHDSVRVHIDPDEPEQVFLTPGPVLISWSYLIKGLVLLIVPVLLFLFLPDYHFFTFAIAGGCISIFEYLLGERYTIELQDFLTPAPKPPGLTPAKTEEDTLELRPLEESLEPMKEKSPLSEKH